MGQTKYTDIKWIALLVCLIFPQACTQPQSRQVSSAEVQVLMDEWLELWNSYDLDLLGSIFLVDPGTSYFSSEKEGLIIGYEALVTHHKDFGFVPGGKTPEKSLWLEEVHIQRFESSALLSAIWYFGSRSSNSNDVQKGPVSMVLNKNDQKELRISHAHFGNYDQN